MIEEEYFTAWKKNFNKHMGLDENGDSLYEEVERISYKHRNPFKDWRNEYLY